MNAQTKAMNLELEKALDSMIERAKGEVSAHESLEMSKELAALVGGDPFVFLIRQLDEERGKAFRAQLDLEIMRADWRMVVELLHRHPSSFGQRIHSPGRHVANVMGAFVSAHLRLEGGCIVWDSIRANLDALGRKR